jgi:two-component system, LuxR family, sensor kinase FixL
VFGLPFRKAPVTHFFSLFRRNFVDNSRRRGSGIRPTETAAAETALAESERQYRDLIEENPLGIQIIGGNGERRLINRALATMLGYDSIDQIRRLPMRDLIAPGNLSQAVSVADMERQGADIPKSIEVDLMRKDGSTVPVQVFQRLLVWEGENAIQRTYIDLSERKQAEQGLIESERQSRDLIVNNPLGIQIIDGDGNCLLANLAMATLVGYDSVDELMNLPGLFLLCVPDNALSCTYSPGQDDDPLGSREVDLVRKDRAIVHVQLFQRDFEWQGQKAIQRTYVDISERRESERALEEHNRTVQDMRHKLAHAFQISTMAQISTVIAHELHQPLAAINNAANAARRRLADKTADQSVVLDEMLPLIADQAERAGRVIRGIRTLFEGRAPERVSADLNLIIEEACGLATSEFNAKNVKICHSDPEQAITVSVERIQIQQVVINLVRNAADALNGAPQKNITVSISRPDDETVQVSVHDNGPGLSPDLKTTLFEPFVTTKKKGMGMGLYACQQIIEGHGGSIWFEPDLDPNIDGGATVSFDLPVTS